MAGNGEVVPLDLRTDDKMKLVILTIVLDGEPFIEWHLPIFKNLKHDWRWIVVHGASMNNDSTAWCYPQEPRLSVDGTTEYLHEISDLRVTLLEQPSWSSKDEMVNVALFEIHEPCILMEVDSDEIWSSEQLDLIVDLFDRFPTLSLAQFRCKYYVGPNLLLEGRNCYGDFDYEWIRAWRFQPGMTFKSHEPPILNGIDSTRLFSKDFTERSGLTFSHYAYATEAQVAYKEKFYGYHGLLNKWREMQKRTDFPFPLSWYFDHVKGELPLVVKA